jgi:DNA-binding beta-propeller fold protein YncE
VTLQFRAILRSGGYFALLTGSLLHNLHAQTVTSGATFGNVIALGGTPSDVVIDEARGKLYTVNSSANRIDVYDYINQQKVGVIAVGSRPLAAAMSMDSNILYVTNNGSSTVSVVNLNSTGSIQTIAIPAKPEGIEVGADGRALVCTQGTGGTTQNVLYILDLTQPLGQQVTAVPFAPPPPTPTGLPPVQARPTTTFRGKLQRTADGNLIIGVSVINTNTQTVAYVYEAASGTVLKSRFVTGQSTTLSVSPDGSKFMAGFTLFDTATLSVIGQASSSNAPFPLATINTMTSVGGSIFTPDGGTIYGAFNVAPIVVPVARPQASTLLVSDANNLRVRLGIKLPESIVAKMVMTSDGGDAWGLSESGLLHLPFSSLNNYPIIMPESTVLFLAQDDCNRGLAQASLKINNIGAGTLTFAVQDTGSALEARAVSGMAPANVIFTMDPGRGLVTRLAGTNLYTGQATNQGTAIAVNLQSRDAINVPNTILVYMNYRQSDQRGIVYPLPVTANPLPTATTYEGLEDMLLDESRGRLYITNSGYNRIEVFDLNAQHFTTPIDVGQLPHQMAMGLDGVTLYVANTGGETISIVDLDAQKVIGTIQPPPIPRAGNTTATNVVHVTTLAVGLTGLQFILSGTGAGLSGSQWEVIANQTVLRQVDAVAPATIPAPQQMIATPGGESILLLSGTGTIYLLDGLTDNYTASRQLFTGTISGYYGPLGAANAGAFFLSNGVVLSPTITQNIIDPGQRNIAALSPIDDHRFVRLTTPVRAAITTTPRDDPRTLLELVDIQAGASSLIGAVAENTYIQAFGTTRVNVPARQMVVSSNGTLYALTLSGLSVISMTPATSNTQPQIQSGNRAILNSTDGTTNFKPGSFITITGTNLASSSKADQLPVPTVLGGSCVVFDNVAVPLLEVGPNQISAQIPTTIRAGANVVQVRSLATAQASAPIVVTVQKP